mgnify:FL=1
MTCFSFNKLDVYCIASRIPHPGILDGQIIETKCITSISLMIFILVAIRLSVFS